MPLWSVIFSISECKYKGKMQMKRQMHRKMVFLPYMRHLSLECRFKAWFFYFRMQIQRQIQRQIQMQMQIHMHKKMVFYALNAASISWMRLRSVIFSISECKYKGKCKGKKGKCIGKWFLCPKCGIYLLNAALKRDFLDFRMQIQRQMLECQGKWHRKMVFMP